MVTLAVKNFLQNHWQMLSIATAGLLIRLYNLTAISLWHDEAFSALLIKYSWGEMMYRIGLDVHPPMYYIFLRIWHYVFADSLLSLRGMSVAFGVATIIAAYFFIKHLFDSKPAALITAVLVAVNPFQVQYVTEARMYTMGAFFAIIAAYALARALRRQKYIYDTAAVIQWKQRRSYAGFYLLFALSAGVMILTHYYLLFTVAAMGIYGLWFHWKHYRLSWRRYTWLTASGAIIVAMFLPWLNWFLYQFKQVGAGYWIPQMNRWSIPDTLWRMVFNSVDPIYLSLPKALYRLLPLPSPTNLTLLIMTVVTLYVIILIIKKYRHSEKWLVLAAFFAPFAGAGIFYLLARLNDQTSSVYLVRYFIFTSTFFVIIISLWLHTIRILRLRYMLIGLLAVFNIYSIYHYWDINDVQSSPGMNQASAFLNANVEPQHKIFVGSSFEFFNYKYYNKTGVRPLLYSGGQTDISSMPHFAGTAILTNEDLAPDLSAATQSGDTVWMIWTNAFGGSQPSVPANWTQIDEKGYSDIKPYVGTNIMVTQYRVN